MIVNNLNKKRYDELLYDSRPVKLSEYLTNKYNIIHNKLYMDALHSFINDWLKFKNDNVKQDSESDEEYWERCSELIQQNPNMKYSCGKIVFDVDSVEDFKKYSYIYEVMPNEYYQPCHINIFTKIHNNVGNLTWEVDLTKYWNNYQAYSNKNEFIKKISDKNINDAEVVNLNYVTGMATLYSKMSDLTYELPFEYLSEDTNVSSEYLLGNHFSSNIDF